ncbi:MAG: 4Fe-4S dicluster domain-containing protein [Deltaproteobacteria bacterium]|nr:4Fe-4S dicluster domain-containing protein [Deltaproteobacteria bacterium]
MATKTIKLPEQRPMDALERTFFSEAVKGLKVIGGKWVTNMLYPHDRNFDVLERKGPSEVVTWEYPDEAPPYPKGYRGQHRLTYREDGRPRCVACFMCSTHCPANCITIEAGELEDDPIEKYPVRFEIDELKCIVCGLCVEACPKDAIRMDTGRHATPVLDRSAAIMSRDQLMAESKPFGSTLPVGTPFDVSREHLRYLQMKGEKERGAENEEERIGPDHRR